MSTNQTPEEQEVDLGQLFNSIGKLFESIFNAVGSVFNYFFKIIIISSKAVIDNFKILVGVLIITGIIGFILNKFQEERFESSMLVKTYFDSKYQLDINLSYYNNLITDERFEELAEIFEIEVDLAKNIKEFELLKGPENENKKLQLYDDFMKSLDSIRAQDVSFDDYLENRDILAGDLFYIRVESLDKNIYNKLDGGVYKSFENLYSAKKMKKRDSMIIIRKQTILESIAEIDSLQNVYINVLEEESQATKTRISLGEGFPLQQEKSKTNEYQLLNKEIQLRDELRRLEEESVEENEFFDIISTFQRSGTKVSEIWKNYMIMLPFGSLILMILGYLISRYVRYVKVYEV